MDCIEAQAAISEALDHSPVDASTLEAAKTHCRECPECTEYVRALNALRRAELPRPPADLTDRIMAVVRAEAARAEQASAVLDEESATAAALAEVLEDEDSDRITALQPTVLPRVTVERARMSRGQMIAWGSAAAVVLLAVGITSALGILRLTTASNNRNAQQATVQSAAPLAASPGGAPEGEAAKLADETDFGGGAALDSGERGSGAPVVSARVFVVFKSSVYMHQGVSAQAKSDLQAAGEVSVAFEADTPPQMRPVYAGAEGDTIGIEDSDGQLQRFVLVTRSYQGTVYRLQSADIVTYGGWPTLPAGVAKPVPPDNPTGAPAFALDGKDMAGTSVYHRIGADRQTGIAIPPGTPATDPAAGNPNWTWWVP